MTSAAVLGSAGGSRDPSVRGRLRDYNRLRPPLGRALRVDALKFAARRGERHEFPSRTGEWLNVLKMCWSSEDYLGIALYRIRAALHAHNVPVLPSIINRVCIALFRIEIGDGVVIREGLYVPHGNIIVGGIMFVGRNAVICPWIGLGVQRGSFMGPHIGDNVFIGSHSSVFGDVSVGDGAMIGAGALVTANVAANESVTGVHSRPSTHGTPE